MKISLILAHPDPASFNHAIARRAVQSLEQTGHEVAFHDLYQEQFDPVLPAAEIAKDAHLPPDIKAHCQEIARAEGIIIVHPNWWGQPPALLKGWIDRVIRPGVAYEFIEGDSGEGVPHGLLKAENALILNTSNTEIQREKEIFLDPLETLWKNCIFGLCGVEKNNCQRRMYTIMVTSSIAQRERWLNDVEEQVTTLFPPEQSRN